MTRVFVDTSALLACLVAGDVKHREARDGLATLAAGDAVLVTSSYVLAETYAIVQRRLGPRWVREVRAAYEPLFEVTWIDRELHEDALDRLLAEDRRALSMVDASSFAVMRRLGLHEAFAFDPHFTDAGFALFP